MTGTSATKCESEHSILEALLGSPRVQMLTLSSIDKTGDTQHRTELNEDLVVEYAELMKNGVVFPAVRIWFDGTTYWLADGFQRVAAAERIDCTMILAEIHNGSKSAKIEFSGDTHFDALGILQKTGTRTPFAPLTVPSFWNFIYNLVKNNLRK